MPPSSSCPRDREAERRAGAVQPDALGDQPRQLPLLAPPVPATQVQPAVPEQAHLLV